MFGCFSKNMATEHVFTLLLVIAMFNYVKSIYSIYSFGNSGTIFRSYYKYTHIIKSGQECRIGINRAFGTYL